MSAPRRARPRKPRAEPASHIHLPSVHIRTNGSGYDFEEDLYVIGAERLQRVVRLVVVANGNTVLDRRTTDVLCDEEMEELAELLPVLMDKGNPDAASMMQEAARLEYERQLRIADGLEKACAACGCSETRACSGGCIWATRAICSRCAL